MVLPYGGRVGWRRIVKASYESDSLFFFGHPGAGLFFYLIILAKLIFPYIRCIFNEVMEKIG